MKSTIAGVLILAAALLQLSCAYPQPNVQVQGENNLLSEIFKGFGDLAKDFVEGFENASRSGAETAQNFMDNLTTSTQQFIKEAEQYADSIGDSVRTFVTQQVTNFTAIVQAFQVNLNAQIQVLENRVKRRALSDIENQLKLINAKVLLLEQNALSVRDHISESIVKREQNILRSWNVWSVDQLEKVAQGTDSDDVAIDQARELINEFTYRYNNLLGSCADEQEFELQEFESLLLETISRYQNVLQQLIAEVDLCLDGDDSYSASSQCRRNVKNVLNGLRKAPSDFAKLVEESAKLLNSDYSRRYCVVTTLVEFKLEAYSIQRQLQKIIVESNERNAKSDGDNDSDSDNDDDENVSNDDEIESNNDGQSESQSDSDTESESDSISESNNQSDNSQSDSSNSSESDSSNQIDNSTDGQSDSNSDSSGGSSNESDSSSESVNQSGNSSDSANSSDGESDSQDSGSGTDNQSDSDSDSSDSESSDGESDSQDSGSGTDNQSDSDSDSSDSESSDGQSDSQDSGSGTDNQSDSDSDSSDSERSDASNSGAADST